MVVFPVLVACVFKRPAWNEQPANDVATGNLIHHYRNRQCYGWMVPDVFYKERLQSIRWAHESHARNCINSPGSIICTAIWRFQLLGGRYIGWNWNCCTPGMECQYFYYCF